MVEFVTSSTVLLQKTIICDATLPRQTVSKGGHGSVKFEEYDLRSLKEASPRLDQFATTLGGWVGARGYIIVYPGGSVTLGQAEFHAAQAKTYLVKNRGIGSDRIVTVIGGFREEPSVELFITVKNGNPPIPSPPSRQGELK